MGDGANDADGWNAAPDPLAAARREALAKLNLDFDAQRIPPGSMGLALSGGGIRSATLSLGFVQALARHKRLLDFDYLSTVSGGGYFGSFLRSLFVPDDHRGIAGTGTALPTLHPKRVQRFVEEVLSLDARQEIIRDPFAAEDDQTSKIRNPIWWLREHGRYLAPNGPTDYGFAISYLVRNWVALLYTFAIGATLLAFLLFGVDWLAFSAFPGLAAHLHVAGGAMPAIPGGARPLPLAGNGLLLSPVVILIPTLAFVVLAAGLAYWLTVALRIGDPWNSDAPGAAKRISPKRRFGRQWVLLLLLAAAAAALLVWEGVWAAPWVSLEPVRFWSVRWPWCLLAFGVALAIVALVLALPVALWTALGESGDDFTNELRRRLTKLGAWFSRWTLVALAVAVVDTVALALSGPGRDLVRLNPLTGIAGIAVPAIPWLIGKVPQWLGGGKLARFFGQHVWTIALVAGALLFGSVAVLADAMVQSIAWPHGAWVDGAVAYPAFGTLLPIGGVILVLCAITGSVTAFINMSSLHSLYAGRLTRAFLGASNIARLRLAVDPGGPPITENHPKDYIDISCYQDVASAAPIHLINVTLNETRSRTRSQIIDRDRKGVPIVFGPDGVVVDGARAKTLGEDGFYPWKALKHAGVESLSVGQLCAISGAAASSGMGARTTLGGALAFSFANVRLGYWWGVNDLLPEVRQMAKSGWWRLWVGTTRPLRTYFYLWNEMVASYTRENRRVYLSDGGHFENSGTYELLRRHTPVIVTCDNGADPDLVFEDLENLARKARIDLGLAVVVAEARTVRDIFGDMGARRFFNGGEADWRHVARTPGGGAFALLLDVYEVRRDAPREDNYLERIYRGRIVWIKPRLFEGLPPDVATYGLRNPPFPQQPTGDQFFDEAQWESYRALGYTMAEALLTESDHDIDAFRNLVTPRCRIDPAAGGAALPGAKSRPQRHDHGEGRHQRLSLGRIARAIRSVFRAG